MLRKGFRRARVVVGLATVVVGLSAVPASAAIVANGDFETGDLTGWTAFTTVNGTANAGNPPDVQSFDTTGAGVSLAAHFNVGQTSGAGSSTPAGGGISQNVSLAPGNYVLGADIATHNSSGSRNADCGTFQLLVDGTAVAGKPFGDCGDGTTPRAHLSATLDFGSAGTHQLEVLIERTYAAVDDETPDQYVDNVTVTHSMQVACSPASVQVGGATTCTATETVDGSPPTGTVTFSTGSNAAGADGSFSPASCTLTPGANSSSCSVTYRPSQVDSGAHTITASYGGDGTYVSDSASTTLTVSTPSGSPGSSSGSSASIGPSASSSPVSSGAPGSSIVSPGTVSAAIVSDASETNTAFRATAHAQLVQTARKRPPVGTTFNFGLNEAAPIRFDFTRPTTGREVDGKCVAQAKRNKRHHRKCVRTNVLGTLSFAGHEGPNSMRFFGWLSRQQKLKPGKYTLVITATTPGAGSTSKKLAFTIVK